MSSNLKVLFAGAVLVGLHTTLILRIAVAVTEVKIVDKEVVVEVPVILQRVESIKPVSKNYWSNEDLHYLTEAIYFEGRSESLNCQAQIGYTIMNRVKKRGKSVKNTIWAYRQFSYTQDGKHERMTNESARKRAEAVAKLVLNGYARDKTKGGEYYYNDSIVDWKFKNAYTFTTKCDKHVFYR